VAASPAISDADLMTSLLFAAMAVVRQDRIQAA
jgi:hypothetical protein